MPRHLSGAHIQSALNRGKQVEQFLGPCVSTNGRAIRYLVLSAENSTVQVRLYACLDVGDENYLDVYSFPEANGGLSQGEPGAEHLCDGLDPALELAQELYGTDIERYVNSGVARDEYLDYARKRGGGAA